MILLHLIAVTLLTVLTQIGGLVYLLTWVINRSIKSAWKLKALSLFLALYLFATFLIVPNLAPLFGRVAVDHTHNVAPTNYQTVLLNRNYVRPALNQVLQQTARTVSKENIEIRYLDANFPFIDGFPLLPHLSHSDGRKIDLSFVYATSKGEITDRQKSRSGYGFFTGPNPGETDQIQRCLSKGYWQYDFTKYLSLGSINGNLEFSDKANRILIDALLQNSKVKKIFIEPHLKQRLGIKSNRVRYHGCQAVRHDDHIHVQL